MSLAHVDKQEPVNAVLRSADDEIRVTLVQGCLHNLGLPRLVNGYAEDALVNCG